MHDIAAARAFMQVVDVLRDNQDLAIPRSRGGTFLHMGQRPVGRIGLHIGKPGAQPVIEPVHPQGITCKSFGGADVGNPFVVPQPVFPPKGLEA